jgi:hypothetical protein
LRGQATDPERNGEINSNSLAKYVRQRVLDLTKGRRKQQEPKMEADPANPIVFRPAAAPSASSEDAGKHEIRITFVTLPNGKVAVRDNDNKIVREHLTMNGDLVIPLANGSYEVTEENEGQESRSMGFFRVLGGPKDVQL